MVTKVVLSIKEKIAAHELLKKHTQPIPGRDGFIVFEDGWSDQRVAENVGRPGGTKSVSNLRRETIGDMLPTNTVGKGNKLDTDAVLSLLGELRRDIDDVIHSINTLAAATKTPDAVILNKK